jgi:hypothetical protein
MFNSNMITLLFVGVMGFVGADAIASNTAIGTGEQNARFQSTTYTFTADAAPTLHAQLVGGTLSLVEGNDVEDLFAYNTAITYVVATIVPPTGHEMDITTVSGPTWTENTGGSWSATFAMPAAGGTNSGAFTVIVDPGTTQTTNGGVFKIKKAGT